MADKKQDLSLASYTLGILSIVFAFFTPIAGLILGIIGFRVSGKKKLPLSKKAKKLNVIGVEKDKIFGIFRRGGFSSRVKFIDHFKEEIQIRKDNKQNKITILLIIIYKSIRHARKLINL